MQNCNIPSLIQWFLLTKSSSLEKHDFETLLFEVEKKDKTKLQQLKPITKPT